MLVPRPTSSTAVQGSSHSKWSLFKPRRSQRFSRSGYLIAIHSYSQRSQLVKSSLAGSILTAPLSKMGPCWALGLGPGTCRSVKFQSLDNGCCDTHQYAVADKVCMKSLLRSIQLVFDCRYHFGRHDLGYRIQERVLFAWASSKSTA